MRILVTGGAGFIGSHLCGRLLEENNQIICVDNLFTGSKDNIKHLLDNDNFKFIEHDIIEPLSVDPSTLRPFSKFKIPQSSWQGKIDQVYNLACPASPVHYQHNPVRTIKANTIGMINMLGLARKHGARILQASTSEVYGDPEVHPQTEKYRGSVSCIGPRACYDEGKRCAETLCFDYHRMHGMEIKVVRIFNTYGPRMAFDDGRVVSNFILQALKEEDITIYGDGKQTRSFCYVDDLVDGLIKMMNSDKEITGPINLGNQGEFKIKELAEKVIELTGSKSKIIYQDLPEDDPKQRCPDIAKAKDLLDWKPTVELEEGLRKTIEDFESRVCRVYRVRQGKVNCMAQIKTFCDLKVWQEAHKLTLMVYEETSNYPKYELFGLTSQSRRSASSVPANIVEGFRRNTVKDSLNFYNKADASLEELKYHLLLANDLKYLNPDQYKKLLNQAEFVGALLTRWMQSQRKYL